jgi:AraC-like DNA-binding protein
VSQGIAFNRAVQLQPFLKAFERRGKKVGPVLRTAGLDHFDLSDPTTLITGNSLYRAVQDMSDALDDPFFGARTAEEFVKAGPVFVRESYAVSHTVAEFLPLAILELDQQISNIRYSLQIKPDVTIIRGQRGFVPAMPIVQADAAAISLWVTFLHLVVAKDFDPSRLLVTAREIEGIPPDLVPKSSCLKQRWNGISVTFPSEWLRRPLDLGWQIPSNPRGEFRDTSPREAILAFVEKICLERLSEKSFGIEEIARLLGVHPRNLQRTLVGLGTSFQQIRDEARRKKALELMASGEPPLNEQIAEALGFSSASIFSRAFKRWTGVSPGDFRKNM